MRKFVAATVVVAMALALPAALSAQDVAAACRAVQTAAAGDWVEYEVTSPQGSGTVRLALLTKGASAGDGEWLEMNANGNGQSMVLQALVGSYPFVPDDVTAVVVKMGPLPAMRVPDSNLNAMRTQVRMPVAAMAEGCDGVEVVGNESVTVPAGTFDAMKVQADAGAGDGVFWVSADVPFGLVKGEGDQGSLVLVGTGDGATSSITETPQDMPQMPAAPGVGNQ